MAAELAYGRSFQVLTSGDGKAQRVALAFSGRRFYVQRVLGWGNRTHGAPFALNTASYQGKLAEVLQLLMR